MNLKKGVFIICPPPTTPTGTITASAATFFVFLLCLAPVIDVRTPGCVMLAFLGLLLSLNSRSQFFTKAVLAAVPLISLLSSLSIVMLACSFMFAYTVTIYEPDWLDIIFNPTPDDETLGLINPTVIITSPL
eukprot:TRINITY_DN2644_c0_g1_i3.p1 TRINITY_DN2644_c0_g1~~TRINITY_DN2644_c0_g1_i3.p1  ORF type:complete len:132 (+),score=14.53 TRINITY_DN2644_c0_g1_i3:3-398(+)